MIGSGRRSAAQNAAASAAGTTDCAARYARKSASPWLHLRNHSSDAFDRFRESCAARSGLGADDARLFAMDAAIQVRPAV